MTPISSTPCDAGLLRHEAGRALLTRLYGEATGQPLPPIEVGAWGKPAFADSGWHFSISHTKKHAFCVLEKENVAIDAEELNRRVNLSLAEKILSPTEKAQFDAADDKPFPWTTPVSGSWRAALWQF